MNVIGLKELIREGGLDSRLAGLYGQENVEKQRERYIRACNGFEGLFPEHHKHPHISSKHLHIYDVLKTVYGVHKSR